VRTVFEEPTIAGLATAVEKAQALGLNQAHTPILQSRSRAAEANASQAMRLIQSEKLSQLEKLSAEEARNLLRTLLDGKQDYELRS
jgi:hypothetical protein